MMDQQSMSNGEWQARGPPPGYFSSSGYYPAEDFPPSPFRGDEPYPRSTPVRSGYGSPEAYWHDRVPPYSYSPHSQSPHERAPWPPVTHNGPPEEQGMYGPPSVMRVHCRQTYFQPSQTPPRSWPSPPKESRSHPISGRNEPMNRSHSLVPAPSSPLVSTKNTEDNHKSSPSSQATEQTSNLQSDTREKDPLSLLAKTASDMGPPKKRQPKAHFEASTPLRLSPIPTSTSREESHSSESEEYPQYDGQYNGPKPITPTAGTYYATTPTNRRFAQPPPPPQYSHRAYQPNTSYRYEPWQMDGGSQPALVERASFDSHENVSRGAGGPPPPPVPPSPHHYYSRGSDFASSSPSSSFPPPPPPPPAYATPDGFRHGPPNRVWYPPYAHPFYRTGPTGPYTQIQKGVPVKKLLRKKFSWKAYPELERFLVENRDEYLKHSGRNYSLEQKQFNNSLTQKLIDLAEQNNLSFDMQDFNFVSIRDRIRCYYKSYVQTARKRGLPLPAELKTSRYERNEKRLRLEDIELGRDDDDDDDEGAKGLETKPASETKTKKGATAETTAKRASAKPVDVARASSKVGDSTLKKTAEQTKESQTCKKATPDSLDQIVEPTKEDVQHDAPKMSTRRSARTKE